MVLCVAVLINALPKDATVSRNVSEEELLNYLQNVYEKECSEVMNKQVRAEWDVATDVNNATKVQHQVILSQIT